MNNTTASAEPKPSRFWVKKVVYDSLAMVLVPKLPPVVACTMSNAFKAPMAPSEMTVSNAGRIYGNVIF